MLTLYSKALLTKNSVGTFFLNYVLYIKSSVIFLIPSTKIF